MFHRLLSRQIKKFLPEDLREDERLIKMLDAVSDSYFHSDKDRQLMERAMEISSSELGKINRELKALVKAQPDSFLLMTAAGKVLEYKSGDDAQPFFYTNKIVGEKIEKLMSFHISNVFYDAISSAIKNEETVNFEFNSALDEAGLHFEVRVVPLHDDLVLALIRDITERKESEDQIAFLAYHDTLTGLPNKRLFVDRLEQGISHSKRHKSILAVMFLDLDRFKLINDTLGHHIGDLLLKETANRLGCCVRGTDSVEGVPFDVGQSLARLGGDEFTIMLDDVDSIQDVGRIAKRIIDSVSEPMKLEDHEVSISTSIGIAVYPDDGDSIDVLLKHADVAMYHAKEEGKNNFQFYTKEINKASLERLLMETNLRRAAERNEFKLFYQPQYELDSQTIVGIEALIRWIHPDLGPIPPDNFIPLAEDTGLICEIGEWVINEACEQLAAWKEQGLVVAPVSINASGLQFKNMDIVGQILSALEKNNLTVDDLAVELTESALVFEPDIVLEILKSIQTLGVKLSLDDFGTGYSSLGYLKTFPFDVIKIDKSFINDINVDVVETALVKVIIDMAHTLNMGVVAEGVETEGQLSYLRKHGCDVVQGYIFSRPLPADEMGTLLKLA